jgi:hypothetical protein
MRYLGLREWKEQDNGGNCMGRDVILTGNHILSRVRSAGHMRTNMHTGFLENVKDSEQMEELGIDGRICHI